ncbi:MAG: HlyD family efflux transporter periplasmic adaptor subunit [Usitatibacter sp.]
MPGSLFRRESEQARSTRWLGRVVLIRPVSFTLITAWALVFAVLLAMFFIFGEYTRKARVSGVLAPREGVAKILAQQSGVVEAVHVKEGAHVRKDEPMVMLGDGRTARGRVGLGVAVISRLEERRRALLDQREFAIAAADAEQSSFAQRRSGLAHEIEQIDGEIATQRARLALASRGVERANRLEGTGFLSSAALDRERDVALDQESRLEQLQRARSSLLRDSVALEFEAASALSRGRAQVAAIEMQRASLDQERVERESQFHAAIVAPTAGTVATVLVEPGQMVVAGTPLAAIVPSNATLEALLYAPSRSIGFVHEGEEVLLRYLAYPHQKFGMHRATIVAVSRNPMLPGELGFTPVDGTREPVYRIKATLDSQAIHAYDRLERLQPGMQFEADILLDRRRLIEWIFEPLLGLAGRT